MLADTQPLVSCIMPTANRRHFVPQAIRYFLYQDYANKELIIIDDGTDPVADLVPADEYIRYIRLEQKTTVGTKRNLACEQAHGEIIAHWDDDDWHALHRLRYQIEELLRSGTEVCGLNRLLFYNPNSGQAWQYVYPPGQRFWLNGSTLCYRRSFWASHRFANLDMGEDARFVWSGRPDQMLALLDSTFHVGIIHGHNVAPKDTAGAYWQPYPVEEIGRLMGDNWNFYQSHRDRSMASRQLMPPSTRQNKMKVKTMTDIAIILTCHEPHLNWLPEAITSIDRQVPAPAERVIAFDRCRPPTSLSPPWRTVYGNWGHPSLGRNAGLKATTTPWMIFWDADNVMPEGYIAAMQRAIEQASSDLAIIYPDIQYCDEHLNPQRLRQMPGWDYWEMRAENCVDTASAWRREALELIGGWSDRTNSLLEDYALALDVTAAGWKAQKVDGPPLLMRVHPASRTQREQSSQGHLTPWWRARSLAIVSLLAGRESVFQRWVNFLLHADLPPKTALYVVDNSGQPAFTQMAYDACQHVALTRRLSHLHFATSGQPYSSNGSGPDVVRNRHLHVARLYASLLPHVIEDLILTLEDDVEPPLDAVRRLGEEIGWTSRGRIGVVAAAYPMTENATLVCAGHGNEQWGPAIPWSQLSSEPFDVGCVGGGCTMWANWALQRRPINFWWNARLGWDAALCLQMRRRGYRIRLHGGVQCQHHSHGRVNSALDFWSIQAVSHKQKQAKPMEVIQNAESWIPPAELGTHIPPYRPTFDCELFINERHKMFSTCPVQSGATIVMDIPGWLRREDALKLYELAYFVNDDILEIGCYQGLSTSILAQAIKDSGGKKSIVSLDKEVTYLKIAMRHLVSRGLAGYVKLECGDGADICRQLIRDNRHFGFVFIDHSPKYQDVVEICQMLPKLLVMGGFCLFHDFNDGQNKGVSQAVCDSLNTDLFEFYGIFGCTALYRKWSSDKS